jgi:hypothetical protein
MGSRVEFAQGVICRSGTWRNPTVGQALLFARTQVVFPLLLVAAFAGGCRGAAAPADIDRLKTLVPSQSHSMADVGFHWTNLWFAGEQKNWPLAQFYFDEARQHIQWTIRIRPIRKDPEGRDVDLPAIFQAVDSSTFAAVKIAIERQDRAQFESAYRQALDGCYSCHKSSGKPYLRPIVPTAPAQTIIDFSPDALPAP